VVAYYEWVVIENCKKRTIVLLFTVIFT